MIPLTVPQILQAAQVELMRQYGRHNAPAIQAGIHAALTAHDARTAALAATFAVEPVIKEVEAA